MKASVRCRQILSEQQAIWNRNAAAILKKPSVKSVHDMRVAGRRLRAAFHVFKPCLPYPPRAIDRALSATGALLGTARDIDVHLGYLAASLGKWKPRDRQALSGYTRYLTRRLILARRAVQTHLCSSAFRKANAELARFASTLSDKGPRLADIAPKRLKKIGRKLHQASRDMKTDPADVTLHALRRKVRRLRYAADFFEPTGGTALKKLSRGLIHWQDILGDRQDRMAGAELVAAHLAARRKAGSLVEEQAFVRLVRQLDAEKEDLQERIISRWKVPKIR